MVSHWGMGSVIRAASGSLGQSRSHAVFNDPAEAARRLRENTLMLTPKEVAMTKMNPDLMIREARLAFDKGVAEERKHQIIKGYDATHDQEHGLDHLLKWAYEYAARGRPVESAALIMAARQMLADRIEKEASDD